MGSARPMIDRACALAMVVGFFLVGNAMVWPNPGLIIGRRWADFTIYPWWAMVLCAVGGLAGLVGLVAGPRRTGWLAVLPAVTGVLAAQLAGLGLVAAKHWHPAFGFGGGYLGGTHRLEKLALVIGVCGLALSLASLLQLYLRGLLPARTSRSTARTSLALGLVMVLGLPVLLHAGAYFMTGIVTQLGAYALIFSVPWGLALIGTRWLGRNASVAVLVTCLGEAALALVGGHVAVMYVDHPLVFLAPIAVLLAALALRTRADRHADTAAPSTHRSA